MDGGRGEADRLVVLAHRQVRPGVVVRQPLGRVLLGPVGQVEHAARAAGAQEQLRLGPQEQPPDERPRVGVDHPVHETHLVQLPQALEGVAVEGGVARARGREEGPQLARGRRGRVHRAQDPLRRRRVALVDREVRPREGLAAQVRSGDPSGERCGVADHGELFAGEVVVAAVGGQEREVRRRAHPGEVSVGLVARLVGRAAQVLGRQVGRTRQHRGDPALRAQPARPRVRAPRGPGERASCHEERRPLLDPRADPRRGVVVAPVPQAHDGRGAGREDVVQAGEPVEPPAVAQAGPRVVPHEPGHAAFVVVLVVAPSLGEQHEVAEARATVEHLGRDACERCQELAREAVGEVVPEPVEHRLQGVEVAGVERPQDLLPAPRDVSGACHSRDPGGRPGFCKRVSQAG
ncbi:Uncharacterised protein [Mycobacteroides abscessus]|nr:Uncharacterised protein [Mycobacteroides abscessus]